MHSDTVRSVKRHRQDFMVDGVVVPEETETGIYGLFGKYRPLSNFHMAPVVVDGRTYKCSEAAYMAEKTFLDWQKDHLTTLGAKEAKAYGQVVTLRTDWEEVKVAAMYKVLLHKFAQNAELAQLLLSTGTKYIEETNWWNDRFWGVCAGVGENNLGRTLIVIRSFLEDHDDEELNPFRP
jgi:N-glycosidase YbiA